MTPQISAKVNYRYARSTAPSVRVSRPHSLLPTPNRTRSHQLDITKQPPNTSSSPKYHTSTTRPKMMLTTSFFQPPMPHYSSYTPPRSSPLSERSANATARLFDFSMPSPSEKKPQRAFKPNPVMQTRDAATKRRRDMFFTRVQNNRNDKQWESRGEQVWPKHQLRIMKKGCD
jgi:hypothetical protein